MKSVILVERNRYVRKFISRELLTMGYRVTPFKNGLELLERLHTTGHSDPIIIERDLSDLDIHAAIQAIRERRPSQPIIVHTFDDENGFPPDSNLFFAWKQSDLGDLIRTLGRI
jgi:CheY-like chemotaxis protein